MNRKKILLNKAFKGLLEQQHLRADSWPGYECFRTDKGRATLKYNKNNAHELIINIHGYSEIVIKINRYQLYNYGYIGMALRRIKFGWNFYRKKQNENKVYDLLSEFKELGDYISSSRYNDKYVIHGVNLYHFNKNSLFYINYIGVNLCNKLTPFLRLRKIDREVMRTITNLKKYYKQQDLNYKEQCKKKNMKKLIS